MDQTSWTNIAAPLKAPMWPLAAWAAHSCHPCKHRTQLRCSLCNLAPSPRGRAAPDPFFLSLRDQLATLAVQHGVPASYNLREFAKAGGLMSYGTSVTEASRQAGLFARLGSAHEKRLASFRVPHSNRSIKPCSSRVRGSIEEKSMYS